VKNHLAILCVLCWPLLLQAQPGPAPASGTAAPETDKTEQMLRRLREALTNTPSGKSTNAAVPKAQSSPSPTVQPAQANPPIANPPVVNPPSNPGPVTPVGMAIPVRGVSTNAAGPASAAARTNLVTPSAPQMGVPPVRNVPNRPPVTFGAQPGTPNPAGPQLPGMGAPAPAPAAAAAGGLANTNLNVAANFDPNENIPAGAIQVQGMEPDQFFEIYSQVSGRTVIRPYTLQGLQKITLKAATDWTRREAVFAMDSVLAQNGVAMIPVGDKFVKAVPKDLAPSEGAAPTKVTDDYADAEPFVTQVVELRVVKPSDVQQLLGTFSKNPQGLTPFDATMTLVIRDYASNVKRMLEVIHKIDTSPKEPDYKLEAIPVKYGKVIDLYSTMQALISGGGAGGAGTGTASQLGRSGAGRYGGSGSRFGMGGGYGGGYGGGGYGSSYNRYGSSYGGGYGSSYGGGYAPYDESVERLSPMQAATPTPTTTPRTSVGDAPI
jgi:hypothetical protein